MIYKIGPKGLERTDVPENHKKNELPIGTILQLNGYDNPKYVIIEKLGIDKRFHGYGALYVTVKLKDFSFGKQEAFAMDHIADKKDNRIHMYFTDEVLAPDEVLAIWEKAKQKEKARKEAQEKAAEIAKAKEARGRELFAKFIQETAQALIIAECEIDKCDLQTDYFATSTSQTVILGWSKHKRDIFSEMRKFADRIPETAHLKQAPEVNSNRETKSETNKSWWQWHPADEHHEKYSMGHGYYLKIEGRYSFGWLIRKITKYREGWSEYLYRSLADRCVLTNLKQ